MIKTKTPLHVSGLWIPVVNNDPMRTGSLGAGLNLSLYLEAAGKRGGCGIILNGERVLDDLAGKICREYGPITIDARSPFSLGKGFGLSAGLALSAVILASQLGGVKTTIEEAGRKAHVLEVEASRGLGDIIAEVYGGFEIRVEPGPPGIGVVERILLPEEPVLVAAELPGREDTRSMLGRISREVYVEALELLGEVRRDPCLESFFDVAGRFTRHIFDYGLVDELMAGLKGLIRGYYRKKNALIVWARDPSAGGEVAGYLAGRGLKTLVTSISQVGLTVEYTGESS